MLTELPQVATTDIAIWASVEAGLAITAGSLACLRPLARRVSERFKTPTREDLYENRPSAHSRLNNGYLKQKDSAREMILTEFTEYEAESPQPKS